MPKAPARGAPAPPPASPLPVAPSPAAIATAAPSGDGARALPVDVPRPVASDGRPSAPATSLFEEQRAIERARLAIPRGAASTGLALLDDYEHSYARRQFGPEALALRVEALRQQGELATARQRASEFERRYPRHPLLARVRELAR